MTINRRKFISTLIGAGLMITMNGCAANNQGRVVYHGFQIQVDKSAGRIVNIHYAYGDELPDENKPSAKPGSPYDTYFAPMQIPEEFKIAWETQDGKKHEARVPVLNRLSSSIENKTIHFLIMYDSVEGYIETDTPYGPKRERFY